LLDALERLQGADQNPSSHAWKFAADVEHKVITVAEVDIGVATPQKHRSSAWGGPVKMMGSRVPWWIGLSFDDATAKPPGGIFADNHFADQEARQRNSGNRKVLAAKTTNRDVLMRAIYGMTGPNDGADGGTHGKFSPLARYEVGASSHSRKHRISDVGRS
jgi:hypothetical protein